MKLLVRTFISWLPLAVAITGICLLVYGTVQQNYRQSLNDPQIQMAQDGAAKLAAGGVPAELVQRGLPLIDAAKSLAPWIAVYDSNGTALESSAVLEGSPPAPPKGLFDLAKAQGNNLPHNTWQPRDGVRIALVVIPVQVTSGPNEGYFVAAGRNMSEVENREGQLTTFVGLAWLVLIVATFATKAFAKYFV
jgi:hypothetical protein